MISMSTFSIKALMASALLAFAVTGAQAAEVAGVKYTDNQFGIYAQDIACEGSLVITFKIVKGDADVCELIGIVHPQTIHDCFVSSTATVVPISFIRKHELRARTLIMNYQQAYNRPFAKRGRFVPIHGTIAMPPEHYYKYNRNSPSPC